MFATVSKWLFSPNSKIQAHRLYVKITKQSRQPVFYADWGVADTIDGRFDVVLLHLYLILQRLEDPPQDEALMLFSRDLQEVFFTDMDRSLREMGVSDTGVGKRIKKMAEACYGRLTSYKKAGGELRQVQEALLRNVYREADVRPQDVAALADYTLRNIAHLKTVSAKDIMDASEESVIFID